MLAEKLMYTWLCDCSICFRCMRYDTGNHIFVHPKPDGYPA